MIPIASRLSHIVEGGRSSPVPWPLSQQRAYSSYIAQSRGQ